MSQITVFTNLTLDGVMQAPGRPDEDTRGGFTRGGWAVPYGAMQTPEVGEVLPGMDALLLGRRTYDDFYGFWPKQDGNPFKDILTNMHKYVVSTTLKEPLEWENSTLLKGNLPQAVDGIKNGKKDGNIVVMGSGELAQSLMKHNLIDRYVLLIHPLVLGSGRRLFDDGVNAPAIKLDSAKPTVNGVIVATYQPA